MAFVCMHGAYVHVYEFSSPSTENVMQILNNFHFLDFELRIDVMHNFQNVAKNDMPKHVSDLPGDSS